jgi:predicted nucleotidyltransferase
MATQGEILDFLAQNKNYFRDRFGITKIGLFGSYARDEQSSDSDIDLIVEFEKNTPNLYDVKIAIKEYIKEKLKCEVDIAREKYIKSIYRDSILKETIYVD